MIALFGVCILFLIIWLCVISLISIVCYVVSSLAYYKCFKLMGYHNKWIAWIPLFKEYGITDCVRNLDSTTTILGSNINSYVVNFWWLYIVLAEFIPIYGDGISIALYIVLATLVRGTCYARIYASIERCTEGETKVLGFISGLFPLIAWIKFLSYK